MSRTSPRRLAAVLLCSVALAAPATGCQAPTAPPSPGGAVLPSPADTNGASAPGPTASAVPARSTEPTAATATGPVAAGELRALAVPDAGFAAEAFPQTVAEMGGAIDPPTWSPGKPSLPVRVADRGVRPASDAADTIYVGCHTSARNGADRYPCNVLIRNVAEGDRIVATTDAGTLTYAVTHTRSIPYGDFAADEETWRVQPGRLVFVMCDIVDGRGNGANWVVYADLAPRSGGATPTGLPGT